MRKEVGWKPCLRTSHKEKTAVKGRGVCVCVCLCVCGCVSACGSFVVMWLGWGGGVVVWCGVVCVGGCVCVLVCCVWGGGGGGGGDLALSTQGTHRVAR